ncbi:MAG: HDOD domain-containing protein [Thiobacillus sp.]|nr:HDOD domain-containing protein [Thiobacillus sp.]
MSDLSTAEAEKLLAGVVIPPRPTVVTAVMDEQRSPEPDTRRIAGLIATDVGLSAAVLKTINSPMYGLRRQISAIEQAVALLGMRNIATLVTGLALRNIGSGQGLDRFWDSAARTALIAAYLTKVLGVGNRDDAYLFGLFHDSGIPLLMQRFPDYKDTLRAANDEQALSFTEVEDRGHGTNHAVVGSLLATNWNLPHDLREAVRYHHDLGVFQGDLSAGALNLIALGHLAEHIESSISRLAGESEWQKFAAPVLAHLMLDEAGVEDLRRDAGEMVEESGL